MSGRPVSSGNIETKADLKRILSVSSWSIPKASLCRIPGMTHISNLQKLDMSKSGNARLDIWMKRMHMGFFVGTYQPMTPYPGTHSVTLDSQEI